MATCRILSSPKLFFTWDFALDSFCHIFRISNISAELYLVQSPRQPAEPPLVRKRKAYGVAAISEERVTPTSTPILCLARMLWGWCSALAVRFTGWLEEVGRSAARATQAEQLHVNITQFKYPDPRLCSSLLLTYSSRPWWEECESRLLSLRSPCHAGSGLTIPAKNPLRYRFAPSLT